MMLAYGRGHVITLPITWRREVQKDVLHDFLKRTRASIIRPKSEPIQKARLGKVLTDGVELIWDFLSVQMPSSVHCSEAGEAAAVFHFQPCS